MLDPLTILSLLPYLALGIVVTVLGARKRSRFALVAGIVTLACTVLTLVLFAGGAWVVGIFVSPMPEGLLFGGGLGGPVILDTLTWLIQWTLVIAGLVVGIRAKRVATTA